MILLQKLAKHKLYNLYLQFYLTLNFMLCFLSPTQYIAWQRIYNHLCLYTVCPSVFLCVHGFWCRISRKGLKTAVRFQWDTNRKWRAYDELIGHVTDDVA